MILALLALCVVVLTAGALLSVYNKRAADRAVLAQGYKLFGEPPGWLPFFGHLRVLLDQTPEEIEYPISTITKLVKRYGIEGHTYRMIVPGGRTYILTANPDIVQHITSTHHEKTFAKGDALFHQYYDLLGKGIFNVNGKEWRDLRSSASKLFMVSSLRKFVSVFHKNAERLFVRIESLRERPEYLKKGIDMQDMFMRYTLDSFAEIGFGVDLQSIEQDVNHFAVAFDKVQTHSERRGRWGTLWRWKEMVAPDRDFQQSLELINSTVYSIIRERETEEAETLRDNSDILSQLLYALKDTPPSAERDQYLRDFVMNFLIAGRDTTAMLLTWTFHLLSSHPEVEQKVLKEIDEVLGDDELTWDNIKACKYIKWVLQEALRLFPPVPVDGYTCTEDDVLPGNYYVRKGEEVYYCSPLMHRRADLFPEPDAFKPERWAEELRHPYSYVPFHSGPRQCLGKEMAYEEAKVMVINMLRRYRLRMHKGAEPRLKAAIILTSSNGMHMDVVNAPAK